MAGVCGTYYVFLNRVNEQGGIIGHEWHTDGLWDVMASVQPLIWFLCLLERW